MSEAPTPVSVPLCDLRAQDARIADEVRGAVLRVADAQSFVLGEVVARFEARLASRVGVAHAIGVASGSDALRLSLLAAGVRPGDAVLTTPFSFFATAGAIHHVGAVPVFADVDAGTFTLTADTCRARLERLGAGPRLRALLPVHLFGQCAPMAELSAFAAAHDLVVVEDAAQALGATDDGRPAGSLGLAAAVSFFPSKNLGAWGDGGAVLTSDPVLAARVRRLRAHGFDADGRVHEVGFNSRLDALQAAVLTVKEGHLGRWNEERRAAAARYGALLGDTPLALPVERAGATHVYHQYVVRTPQRDALAKYLTGQGIATRAYYGIPLHQQPCFAHEGESLPVAEELSRTSLALPMFAELTVAQQERVAEAVRAFFR